MAEKKDSRLKRAGVSGYNKPKRTPSHPTKSHVVVAKEGGKVKTIRFGQQGVTGDRTMTKRAKSFKARHRKNIANASSYNSNKNEEFLNIKQIEKVIIQNKSDFDSI